MRKCFSRGNVLRKSLVQESMVAQQSIVAGASSMMFFTQETGHCLLRSV